MDMESCNLKLEIDGQEKHYIAHRISFLAYLEAIKLQKMLISYEKKVKEIDGELSYEASLDLLDKEGSILKQFTIFLCELYKNQITYDDLVNGIDKRKANALMIEQLGFVMGK